MRQEQHTILLASGIGSRVVPSFSPAGVDPWEGVAQLVLLPTEACNLRCVYCYQGHEPKRMSPEIRRSVLGLLERLAGKEDVRRVHIDWYGGEPLAAWPIMVEIGDAAQRLASRSGKRLSMSMTTNGTLLTRQRIERLTEWGCTDYQITVDGPQAEHDLRRVSQGGSGSFAKVWAALTALRQSRGDYRVVVRLGVDRANLQAVLDWLPELALQFGGDPRFEFSCRPISYPGGRAPQFSPAEVTRVQRLVADELRKVGLRPVDWSREARPGGLACHAGRANSVMIGARGELHKCAVGLELPENHVGQLGTDGTLRLDQGRWQLWVGSKMPCQVAERARRSAIPKGFRIPSLTLPLSPQAACPLGPEAACPLSPQAACPLGPEAACPLSPQAACPLGPEAACPLSPQAACPLGPESACPLSPQAACPLGPEAACPLSPQAACPLGPETACPLSPQAACPLGPEAACPLSPQAACPLGPEAACPLSPQAACPLGPEAACPLSPQAACPLGPEAACPLSPQAACPLGPEAACPLSPQAACPLGPEAACPLSPQAACPLGPEAACPLSPQAACPLGPEAACPLSPQAACPLGPEAACPLSPQAACPLGPEAACPLSPQAACPLGPEAACPLGPEAACPVTPQAVSPPPRVDYFQMRAA